MVHRDLCIQDHTTPSSTCGCTINVLRRVRFLQCTHQPGSSMQPHSYRKMHFHYADPCNEESTSCCRRIRAWCWSRVHAPSIREYSREDLRHLVRDDTSPLPEVSAAIRIRQAALRFRSPRLSETALPNSAAC